MKKYVISVFILIIFSLPLFALDADLVIAYPVPIGLSSSTKVVTIGKSIETALRIDMTIYDINGDRVFNRNYSALPIKWNLRNGKGNLVSPGLYFIKIIIENNNTGNEDQYIKKILRILVKR